MATKSASQNESKEGNGWRVESTLNGHKVIKCDSWLGFVDFMNGSLDIYTQYVYRGHASELWSLNTTLDRHLQQKKVPVKQMKSLVESHLSKFKLAARGRRVESRDMDDKEWWALGQHHGLLTPLLDWSESPYVAAYFAFASKLEEVKGSYCVVYCLSKRFVNNVSEKEIEDSFFYQKIEFFTPQNNENPRLVNQRGLFTYTDPGTNLVDWVTNFAEGKDVGILLEIRIPRTERDKALVNLNRMNVNHLSLFPDLYGASKYCNMALAINKY